MNRKTFVSVLVLAWAALAAASFIYFRLSASADMGFTRGLNRVEGFLAWQAGALVAAFAALFAGAKLPADSRELHWLARTPLLAELALAGAMATLVGYGLVHHTPPADMPPALEPSTPTQG